MKNTVKNQGRLTVKKTPCGSGKANPDMASARPVKRTQNTSASKLARAAISAFDNDFDLDLDLRDIRRLEQAAKKLERDKRKRKLNPKAAQSRKNPSNNAARRASRDSALVNYWMREALLIDPDRSPRSALAEARQILNALNELQREKAFQGLLRREKNPMPPIAAFAAGASGILSALQIKKLMAEEAATPKAKANRKKRNRKNPRGSTGKKGGEKRGEKRMAFIRSLLIAGEPKAFLVVDEKNRNTIGEFKTIAGARQFAKRKNIILEEFNPKKSARKAKAKSKSNPKKLPRRRTFEIFQGRQATTARALPVSPLAPARLDQLGDLIELKLSDGRILRPNPQRFKLCAAGGRLWIAGGKFARIDTSQPARVLNPLAEIDHVVYGTFKPHHGDLNYTHYIHRLGEETGHRPILAVDAEGYPVIRGGKYKIEARGIVN